jgi:formylglycine-generating enzyme required for sulfatase activity
LANAQGLPEYRHRLTGVVLVRIPGGRAVIGSPEEEAPNREDEHPPHAVELSPFLIAKYELSQSEWRRVMGEGPFTFAGDGLPAETLSWNACSEFLRRAGLQFPTEAQWEHACRAGSRGPFSSGERLDPEAERFAGDGRGGEGPAPARSGRPNAFGLHHLHGNVPEWCADVFLGGFYAGAEASRPDPVCASGSEERAVRGGSWQSRPFECRSARRIGAHRGEDFLIIGLRPVFYPLP